MICCWGRQRDEPPVRSRRLSMHGETLNVTVPRATSPVARGTQKPLTTTATEGSIPMTSTHDEAATWLLALAMWIQEHPEAAVPQYVNTGRGVEWFFRRSAGGDPDLIQPTLLALAQDGVVFRARAQSGGIVNLSGKHPLLGDIVAYLPDVPDEFYDLPGVVRL